MAVQVQAEPKARSAGSLATAGAACGLIGLFLFGVVLGPMAFVLGLLAANRLEPGQPGRGNAITAIVLGVVDVFAFFTMLG
ncbi:DUF4190 domain-containing protein [Pseudonocardia alni]|uniref:DUF4190 domain-containing protein n=1 Tax=Pseudonocardia alni TaxID=33907 RepID=A0AA44UQI6_PSEA5|nr:DUF4190 domain-containing protein [Pseudonocardia alni]PKB31458.1 protein of unknown function (DUF4190) [Pseudonocardia alni]